NPPPHAPAAGCPRRARPAGAARPPPPRGAPGRGAPPQHPPAGRHKARPGLPPPNTVAAAAACRDHRDAEPGARPVGDPAAAIGNTRTMSSGSAPTLYHRWLARHAASMRRAAAAIVAGLTAAPTPARSETW